MLLAEVNRNHPSFYSSLLKEEDQRFVNRKQFYSEIQTQIRIRDETFARFWVCRSV